MLGLQTPFCWTGLFPQDHSGSLGPSLSKCSPWAVRGFPAAPGVQFWCSGWRGSLGLSPPGSVLRPSARWGTSFRVLCGQLAGLTRLDSQLGTLCDSKGSGRCRLQLLPGSFLSSHGEALPTADQRGDRFKSRAGLPLGTSHPRARPGRPWVMRPQAQAFQSPCGPSPAGEGLGCLKPQGSSAWVTLGLLGPLYGMWGSSWLCGGGRRHRWMRP